MESQSPQQDEPDPEQQQRRYDDQGDHGKNHPNTFQQVIAHAVSIPPSS
jgi:hypothetical protein